MTDSTRDERGDVAGMITRLREAGDEVERLRAENARHEEDLARHSGHAGRLIDEAVHRAERAEARAAELQHDIEQYVQRDSTQLTELAAANARAAATDRAMTMVAEDAYATADLLVQAEARAAAAEKDAARLRTWLDNESTEGTNP